MLRLPKQKFFNRYLPMFLSVVLIVVGILVYQTLRPQTKTADAAWYSGSSGTWLYRKPITIDHTKVTGTSTPLSNFPMLFSVTDNDLKFTGSGGRVASSTGADILFTASDGTTLLNYEIESYSSTTGATIAWVNISSLSPTTDTTLYIYFGNASAAANTSANIQSIWDSNYKGVWHMAETSTATSTDSTSNANNLTKTSSTEPNPTTAGKINGAQDFDGSNDLAQGSSAAAPALVTVESWMKADTIGANGAGTIFGVDATQLRFQLTATNTFRFGYLWSGSSPVWAWADNLYQFGSYYHVVVTYDSSSTSNNPRLYINGVSFIHETRSAAPSGSASTVAGNWDVGNLNNQARTFDGILDEVRVSNSIRSAAWIAAEYQNQSSPSTFYAYGALGVQNRAATTAGSAVNNRGTGNWYNTAWTNRRTIYINPGQLSTTATSTFYNFPMLFSSTDSEFKTTANGGKVASSTGADILFTASDGTTKLNYEMESYASSTGAVVAWVQIPLLQNGTYIYMYYGNSTAGLADQQAATATWDSNYKGVWHLPDGTTLSANDSTTNGANGTVTGAVTAAGQNDGAASFSGASDSINVGTDGDSVFTENGALTIEAWINVSSLGGVTAGRIIDRGAAGSTNGPALSVQSVTEIRFRIAGSTPLEQTTNNGAWATTVWKHIVATWDGSTTASNVHIYTNGVENTYLTTTNGNSLTNNSTDPIIIGNNSANSRNFDGKIDEVRLSNVVRSQDWIKTEYNNQNSPSTFYTIAGTNAQTRPAATPFLKSRGGVRFR